MKITFIGAVRTVTGSLTLIEANEKKFLIDCGLYQGKRKEAFEINRNFEFFDPAEIDFVILTHAHIDHAGNLPSLVKKGFNGNIYSTFATRDLCSIMLRDSAKIQLKDVEYVNKKRAKKGQNLFEPLYLEEDVEKTLSCFIGINYRKEIIIDEGISFSLFNSGHILGSSGVYLTIKENGRITTLFFTGDIGREKPTLLKKPDKIPDSNFLFIESTYGGRFHKSADETKQILVEVINKSIQRKSKIITPSFSVGRTQELIFELNQLFETGLCPRIPIYVDSPLSVNATEIFRAHPEAFDTDVAKYILEHKDPFGSSFVNFIADVEESKSLNSAKGPMMIISSSGMCEAGRILHHLANNVQDPNNIILITGYCAEHTLGRKIVEREPIIKIFGEEYELKSEVYVLNSLSAHADSNELLKYCSDLNKGSLQTIFLLHGDYDQQLKFKERLSENGFPNILIPEKGDIFEY